MNVKDLKSAIADMPDDSPVFLLRIGTFRDSYESIGKVILDKNRAIISLTEESDD